VNPVEVIYAAFPAFLYLDSSLAGALLEPLLEFQTTPSLYSHGYAAPDLGMCSNFVWCLVRPYLNTIGSSWPQVKGNNTDQSAYAVESRSSPLLLTSNVSDTQLLRLWFYARHGPRTRSEVGQWMAHSSLL
jgi:hypothetical protein